MKTRTVKLSKATEADLAAFMLGQGQTPDPTMTLAQQRAAVKAFLGDDEEFAVAVDDGAPEPKAAVGQLRSFKGMMNPPRDATEEELYGFKVSVIIPAQDIPGGDEAIYVGVNGKGILVPRTVEAEISWPYYEALINAKRTEYRMVGEGTQMRPVPNEVPMYPVTRVA